MLAILLMALFPILTANGDTIVTSDGFAIVVEGGTPPSFGTTTTLIVPSDTPSLNAAVFQLSDATILATPTLAACELGAMLPNGIMCLQRKNLPLGTQAVSLFAADYSLIANVVAWTPGYDPLSPVYAWGTDTFYTARSHPTVTTTEVKTVSSAGVLGGTTWTLPASSRVFSIGVSNDATLLYYTVGQTMKTYHLNTLSAGADLFSLTGDDKFTYDLYVLPDGSLLVGTFDNVTKHGEGRRYSSAGTLLQTYDFGANADAGSVSFIGLEMVNQETFTARTFPTEFINNYLLYRISDGVLLFELDGIPNADGTGTIPFSCPMFMLGVETPATTYPIRRLRRFAL